MQEGLSQRQSVRKPVLLSAMLEADGTRTPVKLRNLSELGALVEGANLPVVGTRALFERGSLRVGATIAWATAGVAGIRFERSLDESEVLRHIAVPRTPPPVDHRRPGFRSRSLSVEEKRLFDVGAVVRRP